MASTTVADRRSQRLDQILAAAWDIAAESGLGRLVAGVSAGRLDAHRRLLARGFDVERAGVSMWLRPDAPRFDTPEDYVIDDLR